MAIPSAIGNNLSQTSGNSICHNILAITSAKQVVIPSATIKKLILAVKNWCSNCYMAITSAK